MITPCPVITTEDVAVPRTLPSRPFRPSRRSLLTGVAGTAGAALLAGCSDSPTTGGDTGIPLERRMRESAVRDSRRLLERYDSTAAAHPALAQRLAPLRAAVAEHAAALAPVDPAAPSPSPSRSHSAPSSAAPSAGTEAAGAAPGRDAVPAEAEEALSALADAERSLAETRTVDLAAAPGELARMLASVAACGAVHAHLLTATPGARP